MLEGTITDRVILKGMQFYGHHGVLPQERELGWHFEVDVEMGLDLERAGREDDISFTVDYAEVFKVVEKLATGSSYHLLEAVAEAVARGILECFPVKEVSIRVKKTAAPFKGAYRYMAVEIRRQRSSSVEL